MKMTKRHHPTLVRIGAKRTLLSYWSESACVENSAQESQQRPELTQDPDPKCKKTDSVFTTTLRLIANNPSIHVQING